MVYLLALVVIVVLGVVLWRAFGPDPGPDGPGRTRGPDDDPEFLRQIDPGATRGHRADPEGEDPGPPAG